jgi:hypothetical protein
VGPLLYPWVVPAWRGVLCGLKVGLIGSDAGLVGVSVGLAVGRAVRSASPPLVAGESHVQVAESHIHVNPGDSDSRRGTHGHGGSPTFVQSGRPGGSGCRCGGHDLMRTPSRPLAYLRPGVFPGSACGLVAEGCGLLKHGSGPGGSCGFVSGSRVRGQGSSSRSSSITCTTVIPAEPVPARVRA